MLTGNCIGTIRTDALSSRQKNDWRSRGRCGTVVAIGDDANCGMDGGIGMSANITEYQANGILVRVGQDIARKKYEDIFWRAGAITSLAQALEFLIGDRLFVGMAYLEALRDYDIAACQIANTGTVPFGIQKIP